MYNSNTCGHIELTDIYEPLPFDIEKLTDNALRSIYADDYTGPFQEDLWKITTGRLNQAVDEVYKNLDPKHPDKHFANKLKYQNSIFSGFKAANQTTTLKHLKIASKAASFSEFKKQALAITNDYNKNWLKAEYTAAKSSLRSAKNFRQAVADADIYPNIEYLPSVAQEPRDEHRKYYHIIRPINDAFWNTHLPPLTWGCQCQWKTSDTEVTPLPEQLPMPSPGLDINPGKVGAIFSKSHPYFETTEKLALEISKQNVAAIHNADISSFTMFLRHDKTNGVVYSFSKLGGNERTANRVTAKIFAAKGNEVELFGDNFIDARVNGILNEFKLTSGKNKQTVDYLIRDAYRKYTRHKQKGEVTIHLLGGYDENEVKEALKYRLRRIGIEKNNIYGIHFIIGDKYVGYSTFEEIIKGKFPF